MLEKRYKKGRVKLPEKSPSVHRLQKVQCQYLLGPKTGEGRAASFPGMNHQKYILRQITSLHLSFPTTHFTCIRCRALARRCSALVTSPLPSRSAFISGGCDTVTLGRSFGDSLRTHATETAGHGSSSQHLESSMSPQKQLGSRRQRSESSYEASTTGRDFWEE